MYKSLPVEDDTCLLECGRYIERNPVRANAILTPSPGYLALANTDQDRKRLYAEYVTAFRPQDEYAKADKLGG